MVSEYPGPSETIPVTNNPGSHDINGYLTLEVDIEKSWDEPGEWAVVLVLTRYDEQRQVPSTKNHQVATVDNSHGQQVHIDKHFVEDKPKEYLPNFDHYDAIDYLDKNSVHFARQFEKNILRPNSR